MRSLSSATTAVLCLLLLGGTDAIAASGDQYTTIAVPGALGSVAAGINNSGQIAGYCAYTLFPPADEAQSAWHRFLFSNGTYTMIDVPGAVWTKALAISDSGQVFGSFYSASFGYEQAFAYNVASGQFTTLPPDLSTLNLGEMAISGIDPTGSIIVGTGSGAGFI